MNEEKNKKREWVKTATIIFLAIMLVLTFFSNTIMNRSLPEVAAQYAQSGTISANIRGTDIIRAVESFAVKADQTRKVLTVPVKLGDEVAVGDTLLVYGSAGSDELKEAQDTLDSLVQNYQKALINSSSGEYSSEKAAVAAAQNAVNTAVANRDANIVSKADLAAAASKVASCETTLSKAQASLEAFDDPISPSKGDRATLIAAVNTAERNLAAATSAQEALLSKKAAYDTAISEVTEYQNSLQAALLTLRRNTALETIDLNAMQKQIADQNKIIAELKGGGDATITSNVNGVVTAINVSAGDTTAADTDLIVVEVPDRGYKVSLSVTKEQSQKVRVGDSGEVLYNYWGDPLSARLSVIRTDTQNPTTNKILDFIIEGKNVESGSQVTISIGERSAGYDVIVPNSAIRSDTNGKFVLAVIAKSSPLGNRYIATRVDVEVLASDDMNSAVSGSLLNGDFVITSSTKPIKAGTQVRLADQVSSNA